MFRVLHGAEVEEREAGLATPHHTQRLYVAVADFRFELTHTDRPRQGAHIHGSFTVVKEPADRKNTGQNFIIYSTFNYIQDDK